MTTSRSASRDFETLREAADRLGVSDRTLRRRIADGDLIAYRLGKRLIRVRTTDVDALLRTFPRGA